MDFEIIGKISDVEIIAVGGRIRISAFLQRKFGRGRRRKLKGTAEVKLSSGEVRLAEVHWFEAHGIGRKFFRVKYYLD